MKILGIESSCDECSASVVELIKPEAQGLAPALPQFKVHSVKTFSQTDLHIPYGGVVPEIASRNHLETVSFMIDDALKAAAMKPSSLDAIAVTNRPGLVGALLVGVSAAKAMAYALKKPLIPVHHLEGHAASVFLDQDVGQRLSLPYLLAIVSGGHTNLYAVSMAPQIWPLDFLKRTQIGRSIDDAAGEAFDKTAKMLGFPYPGGAFIEKNAVSGDPKAYHFPRALPQKTNFDFSFSGMKTSVSLTVDKLKKQGTFERELPNVCASVQEAIIETLSSKIFRAIEQHRLRGLVLVGGVAANQALRRQLQEGYARVGLEGQPVFPKAQYCTDNAAMIAAAGTLRFQQGYALKESDALTLNAIPNPEV